MASTSDIKNGLCIDFHKDVYAIVEFQHVKPGKGNAFVRTKLKSFATGKIVDHTFPAGHKIQIVRVERRVFQFLYKDDMGYHFMDTETYDQITLEEKMIDNPQYIKESSEIEILFDAVRENPLTVDLPQYVELEITYTEPGIRGDTATNATKPAKTETGGEVRVPLFINEGDIIKVDTKTGSYVERVKK